MDKCGGPGVGERGNPCINPPSPLWGALDIVRGISEIPYHYCSVPGTSKSMRYLTSQRFHVTALPTSQQGVIFKPFLTLANRTPDCALLGIWVGILNLVLRRRGTSKVQHGNYVTQQFSQGKDEQQQQQQQPQLWKGL